MQDSRYEGHHKLKVVECDVSLNTTRSYTQRCREMAFGYVFIRQPRFIRASMAWRFPSTVAV